MASMIPHQFYNDYSLHSDFYGYPTTPAVTGDDLTCGAVLGATMWGASSTCEESLVPFCDHDNSFDVVSPESDKSSSIMTVTSFPDLLGISDEVAVPGGAFSDYGHIGFHGVAGINNNQNFGGEIVQVPHNNVCDHQFGEECCNGLIMPADVKPFGFGGHENSGMMNQGNQHVPTIEQDQSTMKVGRYSDEERKERIDRYLKKRNQRNFNKTIKYACRKTLADRRVRVRGRFARNGEISDHHQEAEAKKMDDNHSCEDQRSELFCDRGAVQMKYNEDDWLLQEAVASLMYLPYVTS